MNRRANPCVAMRWQSVVRGLHRHLEVRDSGEQAHQRILGAELVRLSEAGGIATGNTRACVVGVEAERERKRERKREKVRESERT